MEGVIYRFDVTDGAGMEALAAQWSPAHGGVDIVVNNAGVGLIRRFTSVTAADLAWISTACDLGGRGGITRSIYKRL